ncbi:MAG: hypothetical protein ACR2N7_02715 [Acidimicrobiia bacterium]
MTKPSDDPVAHDDDQVEPGWPWSFILLVVAGGIYLVVRFVELFAKLI